MRVMLAEAGVRGDGDDGGDSDGGGDNDSDNDNDGEIRPSTQKSHVIWSP